MSVLDRAGIEARLPHREPFLFLDAIVDRTEDGLVAEWTPSPESDFYRGHYPGEPVTPGVILSEHCFQAAAVFISEALSGFSAEDGVPVLTKVEGARFKRIVRPGETLTTRVSVRERLGPAWYMKGHVTCGDETVLKIQFVLSATQAMARMEG